VFVSLAVASSVGLFCGVYPAVRASRLDPVVALRQE
jgi:ABC-type antimicrobial peptide transport system permease subunit